MRDADEMPLPRGRSFLHSPGPTTIPDRVLRAMQRPAVDLGKPEFVRVLRGCIDDLRPVFRTAGEVFAFAANGHGAWEAALVNTLSPGDLVLVPGTGQFSAGWMEMAASLGVTVEEIPSEWRRAIDLDRLEARLREDRAGRIRAVLAVHTDTASGVTSDIAGVRRAIDAAGHGALLLVDAVASLATVDFRMDEWGVDVAVAASQKGLMAPAGIGLNAVGPRAVEAARSARLPRNYWDWARRRGDLYYEWMGGTSPQHLVYALREALDMIAEEGLETAFERHARIAGAVRACVETWSGAGVVGFNAEVPAERSNAVTTVRLAEGHDALEVIRIAHERFDVYLGGGLGRLKGRCFRIAHMGWINEPMVFGALASVEATLRLLGIPHAGGGVESAIRSVTGERQTRPARSFAEG